MAARLAQPIKEKTLTEQAAFFRLMSLASELCGTYGRDPTNPARGDCAWGVDPLCTALELKQSLVEVSGARGVRQARRAAGLVTPGSASPAESLLAMAMSLPASLGGVPFPAFQHNKALSWPQDVNGATPPVGYRCSALRPKISKAREPSSASCASSRSSLQRKRRPDFSKK